MLDALRVKRAAPTNHAVDRVAFSEELLCKVRAVLSGYSGDKCGLHEWVRWKAEKQEGRKKVGPVIRKQRFESSRW